MEGNEGFEIDLKNPENNTFFVKEEASARFGGDYPPYLVDSWKRAELDNSTGVEIKIPEELKINEENVKVAMDKISKIESPNIDALVEAGFMDTGSEFVNGLNVNEVRGTSSENWEKIVGDASVNEVVEHVREFASRGDYWRKSILLDEFQLYGFQDADGKKVFGVASGQHRLLTLKILCEMGCEVVLNKAEVRKYQKN